MNLMGYHFDQKAPSVFIDIDGVIVDSQTEEPVEGAVEEINQMYDEGWTIILTTNRGNNFSKISRYNIPNTERLLKTLGIKYHHILYDIPSPRIVINDKLAFGVVHEANRSWDEKKYLGGMRKYIMRQIQKYLKGNT